MRDIHEVSRVLDGLEDMREDILLNVKQNYFLDFAEVRCKIDIMIETLEWVVGKRKELDSLKKILKLVGEKE